ncbi:GAF domain-containing sensor histidine kinase [Halovivax cerinus]|uniref:histidine kinase n=1 Tax=Halovivax cerinus TaxID=1487865 RepID=A0ABD5NIR8_9EURY|nr:ATP-binding protein [Halovivax cerinus]
MADGTDSDLDGLSREQLSERVTLLGEVAATLETCESADEIYQRTVSPDGHVLDFDAAIVCTVSDGVFVPKAAYAETLRPADPLPAGDGIAGRTVEAGEPILVSDVRSVDDAAPTGHYRSVVSLPLADDGVVQFHASGPDAFSPLDLEIGELLVSTVTNALGRVEQERARNRERDQFAALFENVPDAALSYRVEDGTPIVTSVNSSFVGTFGEHGADVVGSPVSAVVRPPPSATEPDRLSMDEISRWTDVEVTRRTPDGPRPFLLRNVPMRSDDDSIRGYLIYTDLHALKARERELERKNERLDQFASMVSHDLRNPLNVAAGYLDLARERTDCVELREIGRAHGRMERLIDDLLSLARAGDTVEAVQPVHLGTIVREAWGNVSTPDATLDVDGDAIVEADPGQLLQLFENLFRNCVEHGTADSHGDRWSEADRRPGPDLPEIDADTPSERSSDASGLDADTPSEPWPDAPGPDHHTPPDHHADPAGSDHESGVSVCVRATDEGFVVEDDGPGIPPADRERIFESGYTTGPDNTGLGLAIVDQIREAHGWTASVGTSATGGARFEFVTGEPAFDLVESSPSEST